MPVRASIITIENCHALSLALLLFTYLILALATAQIHYLETVHRVTIEKIFSENLFGSSIADVLAALGLFLLFLCLSFRHNAIVKIASIGVFTAAIAATGPGYYAVQIAAVATVPIVAALVLVNIRLRSRRRETQESTSIPIQKQKKIS